MGVSDSVGTKLAAIRSRLGMTQDQAAAASGVAQQTISAVERDKRIPGLDTLRQLASGYGLTAAQLVAEIVGADVAMPPGLVRLVESRLAGDLTPEEIRRLSMAQVVVGAELEPTDFLALLSRLRSRP